ncbi:hypothetical protein KAF25_001602 [Fusarium avenaceum]|uniref:Uncharacterized protein n=1 Tax=Fusarium avenaceum TaxID=40199 RepID=A0A9P7GZX8_9HYPO|nr:hypothetical protein KAF25_001602 [Fusarium avenaceum]
MVHVRDVAQHQHWGNRRDLRSVVSELNLPADVLANVTFGRLLLTTYDLAIALALCQNPMRTLGTSYDVVCCNCGEAHNAWDLRCTNIKSVREHQNSAIRRQTEKKQQAATAASTSLPSDSSSQETPHPSPQDTPPSMSPEAPTSSSQATPKKPRGKPPKAQVADHLKQSSMHAFTIKQSASTIVEPTPSSTTNMPDDSSTEKPYSPLAIFDDINVAKKEEGSQGGSYRVNNDNEDQGRDDI